MAKRILVPVDFSKPSLRALDYAVDYARLLRAELLLLHVVEPVYYTVPGPMFGGGENPRILLSDLERTAAEQMSELAARLRARRVAVRPLIGIGAPHQVIAETATARSADLIIMSTHGRTGFSRIMMGSVAERVVRIAPCPVLSIRAGKAKAPRQRRAPRARRPAPARRHSRR